MLAAGILTGWNLEMSCKGEGSGRNWARGEATA